MLFTSFMKNDKRGSNKIIVIRPAYNAIKTLKNTLNDIPKEWVNEITSSKFNRIIRYHTEKLYNMMINRKFSERRIKMQINRLVLSTLVALMLLFPHAYSEDVVSLTLEECIVKAMENNLKVAVEVYNPELAEANLSLAKEMFMPRFDLSFGSRHMEEPSYWWLQGEDMVIDKTSNYSMALVQRVPTGGSLTLSLNSYQTKTNQSFQLINPRYGSTLQFDFNQPLLRDFGFKVSRKEIIIAQNNLDISLNQYKSVLTDIIYRVQEAYWNLVFSVEDHKVKKQSLELAEKLRQKNKREVELGKLAPIELLNAEAVVASREAELLQAEALIRRNQDILSSIMNLESGEKIESLKLIPLEQPDFIKKTVSFMEAIETAKNMRPELARKRLEAEEKKLEVGMTTNFFILQYQEELTDARSQELRALVDYNLAWSKLEKAMGTSLKERNVKIKRFSSGF